jgi:SAM-dependent methyltransferase
MAVKDYIRRFAHTKPARFVRSLLQDKLGVRKTLNRKADSMNPQAIEITPEISAAAELSALGASPALHPNDHLLAYIVQFSARSKAVGPRGGVGEYFENGKKDADQIQAAMSKLNVSRDSKILEFAAGYGRVSRHLAHLDMTCADIHADAVEFLSKKIGVSAIKSSDEPDKFDPAETYDFIFVLSFFSHLPDGLFGRWLSRLSCLLRPNGKLLFTTHGEHAGRTIPILAAALQTDIGYGYLRDATDQPDLDAEVYGSSITTPVYVVPHIYRTKTPTTLVSFSSASWWALQDEWIISALAK